MTRTLTIILLLMSLSPKASSFCTITINGPQSASAVPLGRINTIAPITVMDDMHVMSYGAAATHYMHIGGDGWQTSNVMPSLTGIKYMDRGGHLAQFGTRALVHNGQMLSSYVSTGSFTSFTENATNGRAAVTVPQGGVLGSYGTAQVLPNYAYGSIASYTLNDESLCVRAASAGQSLYYIEFVTARLKGIVKHVRVFDDYMVYNIKAAASVEIPLSVTSNVSSLNFGRVLVGSTATEDVAITVRATPKSQHELYFSYTSETQTNEVLSVSGVRLPYQTPRRDMPSNALTRTDVFRVGIQATNAGAIRGRLLITARIR